MPDLMILKSCSVVELFSDAYRYALPYFQRGYAWQEDHAERLLDDILDVAEERRALPWYPLGSIIVAKPDMQSEAWLTDGHQRLVTLTILLAILRDLETEPDLKVELGACIFGTDRRPRLTTQEKVQHCLSEHVQLEGATATPYPGDLEASTSSEANIIANRNMLRQRLQAIGVARRRKLARCLLDRCVIVVMQVASLDIARVLFSTMHDTGLKPTTGDLFKCEVLGTIDADQREESQAAWELLEAALGRDKIDLLMRQIATIATRKVSKAPVEEQLDEHFKLDKAEMARDFVVSRLTPVGAHMVEIMAARLATNQSPTLVQRYLRFLSWVRNHDTWMAPALHWLDKNGADEEATVDFLRRLEALAWSQMIIATEPGPRDNRYMQLLQEISQGRALDAGGVLTVTAKERADVRAVLAAPNFIKRRYKQFLLLRIDAALGTETDPLAPPVATVEHVYPGRPADSSQWRQDFRGGQAAVLRQMLGNLTLLTTDEQNIAKNQDFVHKLQIYAGGRFAVTRSLARYDTWKPADVRARTQELIDIAMRGWRLG